MNGISAKRSVNCKCNGSRLLRGRSASLWGSQNAFLQDQQEVIDFENKVREQTGVRLYFRIAFAQGLDFISSKIVSTNYMRSMRKTNNAVTSIRSVKKIDSCCFSQRIIYLFIQV